MSSQPSTDPSELYRRRRQRFETEAEQLADRSGRIANLRLLVFLAALPALGWGLWGGAPLVGLAGLVLLGLFAGLVVHHRRLERTRRRLAGLARINREAEWRLARDWAALPLRHTLRATSDHPYAADLDLLGHASLMQLLDAVGTRLGERTLGRWLLGPAAPDEVRERQAAAAELASLVELRDELAWRGQAAGEGRPDPAPFLDWAEAEPHLARQAGLVWAARIGPLLLLSLGAAALVGLLPAPLWLLPLALNLWLSTRLVGPARRTIEQVSELATALGGYADALDLLAGRAFQSPALGRLQAGLAADDATAQLRRLHRLTTFAQPPTSQLYPLIELATLWNVHVLWLLERWQAEQGRRARRWLEALGEVEALACLARLAHDNPGWAFATVDPAAETFAARDLGHPLLPPAVRVCNDLQVGPPGAFLLVTGSNMSGKSTLLRAIGLNAVLAQAGAPVCAAMLQMPPLDVWTSMRLQDSLERGVSFFMAELQRLKQVVDAARFPSSSLCLYLLDEILQGTNTAERQIAARRIIRLLLRCRAIGAVSTHDLTLADAEDLARAAEAVHLTETVVGEGGEARMTFDYQLRPGIARSTNALKLMELVGLPAE